MSKKKCPICGKDDSCTQEMIPDGYMRVHCQTLNYIFNIDEEFLKRPYGDEIKEESLDLISEHLLRRPLYGKQLWWFYYEPNYETKESDEPNYINLAERLDSFPKTVTDVSNRTLINLAVLAPKYGDSIFSDYYHQRLYFEHNWDPYWSSGVLPMLEEMGYLIKQGDNVYKISVEGWEKIESLHYREHEIQQGFIAMSFKEETRSIREAFKQAIRESGYSPYICDESEHNNQIVPEMFFEIQRSKFMVVDVTDPNFGAYYEAGYAQALNKQVIVCCRKAEYESPDRKKQPHFDIAQKLLIVWETENELIERLKRRIKATVD